MTKAMRKAAVLGAAALAALAATNARADEEQVAKPARNTAIVASILVCSATTARADCDATNALDVIAGPPSASEIGCGVLSEQMMAVAGIAVSDGQYVKIGCVRRAERND